MVTNATALSIRRAIRLERNEVREADEGVDRAQQAFNNALERRNVAHQRLDDLLSDAVALGVPIDQELGLPINQCSEPPPRIIKDQPQA